MQKNECMRNMMGSSFTRVKIMITKSAYKACMMQELRQ
jgi:hypothetical protein